jgi:hypothetical protein
MSVALRVHDLTEHGRPPALVQVVAGAVAVAAAAFGFVLSYLAAVTAPLAAGIGLLYFVFVVGAFAAMRRIRAE